jgi:N-acetylmuramoyl-L-alanine amidase
VSAVNETGSIVIPERPVNPNMAEGGSSSSLPANAAPSINNSRTPVTISAVEVDQQYNRVIIRGSGQLTFNGNWDAQEAVYRVMIPNARLADNFKLPSQNEINLQISSVGTNAVQVDIRRFDRNQIGPVVQYYTGQVLSLPYNSITQPVAAENRQSVSRSTLPTTIPAGRPINHRVLVMLDPGHGGKDPGAIGVGGVKEANIVLSISKKVAKILERQGVRTKLTRDSDYFVDLNPRVEIAKRANANVFVSIHANSFQPRPEVNGLEIYFYGSASGKMAEVVKRNILETVAQKGFYINNRNTRSARYLVLRKSQIPAILVETGYVTNAAEAARLQKEDYQAAEAEGIAKGIIEYLRSQ